MRAIQSNASLMRSGLAATVLLLASSAGWAQTISLTAKPTTTTLPDGQSVPMWGLFCNDAGVGGATCAAAKPLPTASSTPALSAPGTPYALGTVAMDTAGTVAQVSLAGTSDIAAAVFSATPGATTTDGSVTWTTIGTLNYYQTAYSTSWVPPVIRVSTGASLTINLTNNLAFGGNSVPTSLVIVGQLGGGLGDAPTVTDSPTHAPQGPTWPASGPPNPSANCSTPSGRAAAGALGTNCPPSQPKRVQSFGTEVAGGAMTTLPTWNALKAGTYLIESGTHPSIQGPMGLYGILIVTQAPTTGSAAAPGVAYVTAANVPVNYGSEVPLLLSEIDPVQNAAISTAVNTAGFQETNVWSGLPGRCGDPAAPVGVVNTCYPPAVNYDPRYYLINGVSFDATQDWRSQFPTTPAGANGTVLVRFVNAGLRMHVPSIVGATTGTAAAGMSLIAEDGNVLPGVPRVQSEVFLAAGKTEDVLINDPGAVNLRAYDRQLSLSTNNRRGGGMMASIGRTAGAGSTPTSAAASDERYFCVAGQTLAVTDPAKGVLANDPGSNGAVLGTVSGDLAGALSFNSDGTFTYTQSPAAVSCGGTFSYLVNGLNSATATITECDATTQGSNCALAGLPIAGSIQFTSSVHTRYSAAPPGVLAGVTNSQGQPLTAVGAGINPDGSFTVTGPGTSADCSGLSPAAPSGATCVALQYQAMNAQKQTSAAATATVIFMPASGLNVVVRDSKTPYPAAAGGSDAGRINDYRWVIEEDRTFYMDPKCQINSTDPSLRPASCPGLPVQSLAYNFHTAGMPIVATGCLGTVSCEGGQTLQGADAACDVGNGECRTGNGIMKSPLDPSQVYLDANKRYYISVLPGDGGNPTLAGSGGPVIDPSAPGGSRKWRTPDDCTSFVPGQGDCGHAMGGAQISGALVAAGQNVIRVELQQTPLPTGKIAVFVFEDDDTLNGENDAGGPAGVTGPAPNEGGLEGFNLILFDQAGGLGDATGQITYDMFNQPVSNSLAGMIDPLTGANACPITVRGDGMVGMIPVCPKFESDGVSLSPLVGQAIIDNMYPGLYEVVAHPGADRTASGEEWLQTNTLDGGAAHEVFIKANEPGYFQEFGPGGFHVSIGFASPKIINDRKTAPGGICDPITNCPVTFYGQITNAHMSRTPDQRIFDSGDYSNYAFTNCYVSLSPPDQADFAFAKCNPDGSFAFANVPSGDYKLTVFDQWNDIMLDGLVNPIHVAASGPGSSAATPVHFPVTQWRTNLATRTFLDLGAGGVGAGDGVSQPDEPGLPLVATNIRYRDGSFGFFNNTDLNGYAGFNEVFPFMNWLVVEADTTRFKSTGTHVVYDTGGQTDQNGGGNSAIAAGLANTLELNSLPSALRVPGARYCANADCPPSDPGFAAGGPGSSGRVDPPNNTTEGWQGLLGQNTFMEFGMKPYAPGETGGIKGHVIYASTRPFDDPQLLLQLSWEPGVPRVTINLYQEGTTADGSSTLHLVDTTKTSSWDDWAQGVRSDGVPNMNCPGQDPTSPFFQTLKGSTQWLNPGVALPNNAQFKCFDGWAMLNQAQPAPYDGMYKFPSITTSSPTSGKPTGTNCHMATAGEPWGCVPNPDGTDAFRRGTPMLAPGKYVVEVIVPPGMELVKEEDKNILLGDIYVAPVATQFAGFGNIYIMPDQAAVGAAYNKNNPGALNLTNALGATPRHEGDTGSIEVFWPCVGELRQVPDYNSLYPKAGQNAPFAGAMRNLCDRKEVTLEDQHAALAKFYVFTSAHVAGHYTGNLTNDFSSEFDPFSPQFGEKFAPPNLPVAMRDFTGKETGRVWSDQWGVYDGMNFSSYGVNPPNPTGYVPQMMIACMNDPGPIAKTDAQGRYVDAAGTPVATADLAQQITDPSYNPAYSNFCYETPFMPGFTAYMDTPVIPTQAFADGYNLPDSEYPNGTPAISSVTTASIAGPWVASGVTADASGYISILGTAPCRPGSCPAPPSSITSVKVGGTVITNGAAACAPTSTSPNCTSSFAGVRNLQMATAVAANINANSAANGGYTATAATVSGSVRLIIKAPPGTGAAGNLPVTLVDINMTGTPLSAALSGGTGTYTPVAITINALGDKVVQNPAYSGPGAKTVPYNQKTIIRHYGFGSSPGTVTVGGVTLTDVSWGDMQITGTVQAAGVPACALQQRNKPGALCGELEITAANGKKSIDTVTVTIGGQNSGETPKLVTPNSLSSTTYQTSGTVFANPLQTAIDNATPGDLIIVGPGTYRETVIMWKPVRLQGVGAASVTINADAHPVGKSDPWRRQVTCLFGLAINGVPIDPVTNPTYDPSGTYRCPESQYLRADRVPLEPIVGWDAAGNGNLAQVLQEPTLMGAYEGAGITVVGRGVRIPAGSNDFWGIQASLATGIPGTFPNGSVYLSGRDTDCTINTSTSATDKGRDYGTANFQCNPSRIDGVSITNSSQGGGGIFMHGWGHNLEISNTRVFGNHGTLAGGMNLGNGETPPLYIRNNATCGTGVAAPAPLCPPIGNNSLIGDGTPPVGAAIPYQLSVKVHVHHNAVYDNAGIGDALFSGTPSGAGGITISAGTDNYLLDHNWVSGNLSTGDGGGIEHVGLSYNGTIRNNWILYNQSTNPTLPTNGGGLGIVGSNNPRTLTSGPNVGEECNAAELADCPPGLGDGTGKNLLIDSNLILGNSAESGSGGGLRLQQVNGTEVPAFPLRPDQWYAVQVQNNVIANNVAGWDGAGVSIEDGLMVTLINNTISSNDTTASAGVLFKTLGAVNAASPPPGCRPTTDLTTTPQDPNCLLKNAAHIPQPAGLVTVVNTPNMVDALNGVTVLCPSGFGYRGGQFGSLLNANCRTLSLPALANDMFWRNRAFHVELQGPGTGPQSQQNLVSLMPALNQAVTGDCAAGAYYWDVGVRDDTSPTLHTYGANAVLTVNNSILSDSTAASGVYGANNRTPANSPVLAQFCNGSRVPPENGGHGYLSPPGRSETTGLSQLFLFNNITPAATVDEGNNWINVTYGPLTLFNDAGQSLLAGIPQGPSTAAYSINATSAAVSGGTNTGAPTRDYFGNPRPSGGTADIGAVEFQSSATALGVVTPSSLDFGSVANGTSLSRTLTLSNNGGSPLTGISLSGLASPFSAAGGSCTTLVPAGSLAAGATCTFKVTFTAPATSGGSSGQATINASVAVINSPVTLSGNSAAPTYSAILSPNPVNFGAWATGTASAPQSVSLVNTGNSNLTGLTYGFSAGTAPFSRPVGTAGDTCGATLAVGSSCTISVVFRPTATGPITKTVTVAGNNGVIISPSAILTLSGTGVAARGTATFTPNPLVITLPSTSPGNGANTGTGLITVTNTGPAGGAQMTIANATITANGTSSTYLFSIDANNCAGVALAPGASCTVAVRFRNFSARGTTVHTGTLTFTDTAQDSPQAVALNGIATQAVVSFRNGTGSVPCATAPVIVAPLSWGTTTGTAANKTVCVVNTGNGDLNLSATAINNVTGGAQFSAASGGTCAAGAVLAASTSCTVVIGRTRSTATPAASGNLTTTDTGAATATQVLTLSGT